ncbi:MAG: hypothetical protein HYX61_07720, partial [Gammaproteobacteria bacterium]|nr:hypothetical protein [Gammaproteobacteria bacterium]
NGYVDRLYFLSDGKPQPNPIDDPGSSIDNRLTNTEEAAWRDLINSKDVEAFMLNIGSTNQTDINANLRDLDDDQPGTVITVAPDLSNLQQLLVATINQAETTGNVLTNDVAGADGGAQVLNIFFTLASSQAATAYLQAHPELAGATSTGSTITIPIQDVDVVTPVGNKIHIDANGNFTYTSTHYELDDSLFYTIKDKDGDTSTTKLLFDLDGVASLNASGQSIDGPLVGATIFQDQNANSIVDANESATLSGNDGAYSLMIIDANKDGVINSQDGRLVSVGGTDTATGLSYQIQLFAPVDSKVITPLTSLLEIQLENGKDAKTTNDNLVKALGLAPGSDLTKLNPILSANNQQQALIQAASVMTLSIQLSVAYSLLLGGEQLDYVQNVYKAIGDQILGLHETANFSNIDLIHSIVNDVSQQLQLEPAKLEPIVEMMKASQNALQFSINHLAEGSDPVEVISQVQNITQGAFAHAITDYYHGNLSQEALNNLLVVLPKETPTENDAFISDSHHPASNDNAMVAHQDQSVEAIKGNIIPESTDPHQSQQSVVSFKYYNEANEFVEAEVGKNVITKNGSQIVINEDGSFSIIPNHQGASFNEVIEFTSINQQGVHQSAIIGIHTADIKPDFSAIATQVEQNDNYIVDASDIAHHDQISMNDLDINQSTLAQLPDNQAEVTLSSMQSANSAPHIESTGATVVIEQITAPAPVAPPPIEQQTHEN